LSNAYTNPADGDRVANVEAPLARYRLALEVRTRVTVPEQCDDRSWQLLLVLQDGKRCVNVLETAHALQACRSE